MYTQRSHIHKPLSEEAKWFEVDAKDKIVGRLATQIATILRGKNKAVFTPNADCGDYVIVKNADKVRFTGNKLDKKKYYWHTGYIGGIKERTARKQLELRPEKVLMDAVKGMLPKNSLGRKQLTKLRVFVGEQHDHEAQKPEKLELN